MNTKNLKKSNAGITLIALVITIIILLILAGVALSFITGNDGILNRTEKAVDETNISSGKEQAELLVADYLSEYYEEAYVNAKQDVASKTAEAYIQGKIKETGSTTSSGDYFVTISSDNKITVYKGTSADENDKTAEGRLLSGGKVEWSKIIVLPDGLVQGSTIKYSPSGTFNWEAEYVSSDLETDGTDDLALATGTQVTDGKIDMSITEWKVLDVNENTGVVRIVPATPTSSTVRLQGTQGYNNAVKMLNDACNYLYADSNKGIIAKSIDIDDIEGIMTEEGKTTAHSYVSDGVTYGSQVSSAYSKIYSYYPTIYAQENLSVIDGTENTGLGMSQQGALIGRNDNGATLGKLQANTSLQPYQTYYFLSDSNFILSLQEGYSSVLLPNGSSTNYWMASRSVGGSGFGGFYVRMVSSGGLNAKIMYSSYDGSGGDSCPLFPVVSLSSELITVNESGEFVVE